MPHAGFGRDRAVDAQWRVTKPGNSGVNSSAGRPLLQRRLKCDLPWQLATGKYRTPPGQLAAGLVGAPLALQAAAAMGLARQAKRVAGCLTSLFTGFFQCWMAVGVRLQAHPMTRAAGGGVRQTHTSR